MGWGSKDFRCNTWGNKVRCNSAAINHPYARHCVLMSRPDNQTIAYMLNSSFLILSILKQFKKKNGNPELNKTIPQKFRVKNLRQCP